VIPAIEHQWLELLTAVVRTGKALRVEGYVAGLSGWFDVHASRIGSPDSCLVAVVFRDTTSRKLAEATLRESEARQAFLVTLHDTLRAQTDATEIQRLATELLGERLQVNRCHYAEVEGDDIRLAGAYVSGVRPLPSRFSQMTFGTALLQASRRGERVLSHNVETDPRLPANDRAALKAAEIAAFVGVMLIKNGQWVAAFGVDSNTPRAWTPSELTLISEVAERTWDAVHRARAEAALRESEAALRSTRDELERRVRERTMELATTNASLEIQIRDRRAAGEQVKALFRRLVSVQEEERRRIARDLHDQLGQQMTALRIQLAALRGNVVTLPDIAQQADRLERATADLDRSIDFLTWGLRPAVLDHLGLAAALRHLVTDWSERFRIPADFQAVGADSLRLSREAEANLYRIAQEALHNVLKHAEANDVAVLLERRSDHAVLIVEDNGRGFDPDAAQSDAVEPGMGLIGMRERAALLGGVFEVETVLGQGTSVFVRVPLGDHTPETSAESHADDPASSRFT